VVRAFLRPDASGSYVHWTVLFFFTTTTVNSYFFNKEMYHVHMGFSPDSLFFFTTTMVNSYFFNKEMHHVHMGFLCTYRVHELIKFTIFLKKIHACSLDPTLSMYKNIKFQVHNLSNEGAVNKTKFLTDLNS
jgi:hypothetical protein